MILAACRAAVEVRPHAGQSRVGVLAGELEVDVLIE